LTWCTAAREAGGGSREAWWQIHEEECQLCKLCGLTNTHGAPDFGRGCSLECSRIPCVTDEIYNWTEQIVNTIKHCKVYAELEHAALCSTGDLEVLNLHTNKVSGNRARMHFTGCTPKPGTEAVSYSSCGLCRVMLACADGQFFDWCPDSGSPLDRQCPVCVV